jgi:hypothetical protein
MSYVCSYLSHRTFFIPNKWQADGDGLYDVQYPNRNDGIPDDRACIVAKPNGEFCYRGILPVAYPIVSSFDYLRLSWPMCISKPSDGPLGDVLRALGE